MAEYIEREALRTELLRITINTEDLYGCGILEGLDRATRRVNEAPAADVVEVVRCVQCRHYRNYPNGLCYLHTEPCTNERGYKGEAVCVELDDFCSYGEKWRAE